MNTSAATRLLAALLAVSLVGNVALLLRASRGAPSRTSSASVSRETAPLNATEKPTPAGASAADTAATLRRVLADPTLTEFRDILDAAGLDPKLRREMIQLALQHRYADRFQALYTHTEELTKTPWWRNPDYHSFNSAAAQRERQKHGRSLQQEFEAELARLTGQDPRAPDFAEHPWLERQYAGLPPEKINALHRLQQDYDELEQDVRGDIMEFQLPADQEKLRLLRAERERDIGALLTPEERLAWEMRTSATADRTRTLATQFQANEDEFRRLYALQKAFDDRFNFDADGTGSDIDWSQHNAAQKELRRATREIVGEERYQASLRENDQDFSLARAAAERLGLPAETATSLHGLRGPVAAESRRIVADPALNPAQKRDALAKLATETRSRVEKTLGAEAAALYFERGAMPWLQHLANGSSIRIDPDFGLVGPETDADGEAPVVHID